MTISFTDYRNDYLKRSNLEVWRMRQRRFIWFCWIGAAYQSVMVMRGEMNMELHLSFLQSSKWWSCCIWEIRRLTRCWRNWRHIIWFIEAIRDWESRTRYMCVICWKQITLIGCQSNLSTERGGQMRKKYYDDAKENAAFERCVDVVTALILKYGPAIKRKWILRDWIKNIQADCFWRSLACKRYQRYFDCMKAIVKNDTTWQW